MIYVDSLQDTTPFTRAGTPRCFRHIVSCHMWSDGGAEELIAFARRIGLRPQWIQRPGTEREHFDLVASRRARAVQLGAVEVERWTGGRSSSLVGFAFLLAVLAAPALAAPPAPPGPLAAIARYAVARAAPELIAPPAPAGEAGDPLKTLVKAGMEAALGSERLTGEELAEEGSLDGPGGAIGPEGGGEAAEDAKEASGRRPVNARSANMMAASWCAVYLGAPPEDGIGCDVGLGTALYRRGRAFLAAVVGSKSAGLGVGLTSYRGENVVVAIAVGVVAPYDSRGIAAGELVPALGCTLSLAGR